MLSKPTNCDCMVFVSCGGLADWLQQWLLLSLDDCVMQVRDFWQDVEAATNERQHAMFQCINKHLESLSRQIETTVGEALSLRLEPVTIAMDPPAAQDFHESLQNLFVQGVFQSASTVSTGCVHFQVASLPSTDCISGCILVSRTGMLSNRSTASVSTTL